MLRQVLTKRIRRREPLKFVSRPKYTEQQEWMPSKGGLVTAALITISTASAAFGLGWLSLKAFKPELPTEGKK